MNKKLFFVVLFGFIAMLTGCEKSTTETTAKFELPPGMEDCKIFKMRSDNGSHLVAVRCPNSSTTSIASSKSAPVVVVDR